MPSPASSLPLLLEADVDAALQETLDAERCGLAGQVERREEKRRVEGGSEKRESEIEEKKPSLTSNEKKNGEKKNSTSSTSNQNNNSASLTAAALSPLTRSSWLSPAFSSEKGSAELYSLLEERVSAPSFLETIERACARARGSRKVFYHLPGTDASSSPPPPQSNGSASSGQVLSPDWWSLPAGVVSVEEEEGDDAEEEGESSKEVKVVAVASPSSSTSPSSTSPPASSSSSPPLLEGSYVLVSRDDALDAVAHFVASYVTSLPQARDLDPEALRRALATTLFELRRGKIKKVWAWGRWLYRAAALSYGAFGAYTNPWLARAVLAAVWTSAKVMVAVAVGAGG